MPIDVIAVPGWPRPKGYVNGAVGRGAVLHVAGQIGWGTDGAFASTDLVEQFGTALDNVLAVVTAAGGKATDIAQMTVYVTDVAEYRAKAHALGEVWRTKLGNHYPAMALVQISALVEAAARVEIQATAYLER
jgi:enamine deaminase RidA (YjgF/YER057c/UK114 family)